MCVEPRAPTQMMATRTRSFAPAQDRAGEPVAPAAAHRTVQASGAMRV